MIGRNIMRKSLVIGIMCLFIGLAFISCASRFDEMIDQHQDNFYSGQGFSVDVNEYGKAHVVAQSFKPSMTPLTKVDLALVGGMFNTEPIVVSIRANLEENDLTSIITPPDQIPLGAISWHSFDFPDIAVEPETTYYIVIRTNQTGYGYCMGYNHSNLYSAGNTWLCYDGNWTAYHDDDCAFRTYSITSPPSNPTNITGPNYGKINTIYTFSIGSTTDPNGDQLYAIWDWGDGNLSGWLGPFNSGESTKASHAWDEPGTYAIRVKIKDVWGATSNWSEPFFITIVKLKPAFFLGSFESFNQTADLFIINGKTFIVFPSHSIFCKQNIIVISKNYLGHLGTSFILGAGGIAIPQ